MRLAPALQLEPLAELGAGLLHRHALPVRSRPRRVDLPHPAKHFLGLGLGEPVGPSLAPDSSDLALDAAAVRPVPRADPRATNDSQRSQVQILSPRLTAATAKKC